MMHPEATVEEGSSAPDTSTKRMDDSVNYSLLLYM